jgi:hypothetical protein
LRFSVHYLVTRVGFSANQDKHNKYYLSTVPLIQSEVLVVNKHPQKLDSITLRYTPTPASSSHFDLYRFMLSDPSIPVKEKAANDTDMKVTFTGLKPGRLYNITVWTVSDGVASQPLVRQDRLCKYIHLQYFVYETWGFNGSENVGFLDARDLYHFVLMIVVICSTRMLATTCKTVQHHNPEDYYPHICFCIIFSLSWLIFLFTVWY